MTTLTQSKKHHVPLWNTPKVIQDHWKNVLEDENDLVLILFPHERYLKNTKDLIKVRGMFKKDGEIYLQIEGENADQIERVTCYMPDPEVEAVEYWGLCLGPVRDKKFCKVSSYQIMDKPTAGVGALIYKTNEAGELEFLMGRRVKGPMSYINLLSNFGGAVELGETQWQALVRELKEEVNLDLTNHEPKQPFHADETVVIMNNDKVVNTYHALSGTYDIAVDEDTAKTIQDNEPHKTRNFGWYKASWLLDNMEELTPLCKTSLTCFMEKRFQFLSI